MSVDNIEDLELVLTEKYDPDDCQSTLRASTMQGCEDITIQVHGMTEDSREWNGHIIFLDVERINLLYRFLGSHLAILNTVGK